MSVEAAVLLPWYQPLFTDEERAIARRRLADHQFDVEDFLRTRGVTPPSWAASNG